MKVDVKWIDYFACLYKTVDGHQTLVFAFKIEGKLRWCYTGRFLKTIFNAMLLHKKIDTCNMASADDFLTQHLLPRCVAQLWTGFKFLQRCCNKLIFVLHVPIFRATMLRVSCFLLRTSRHFGWLEVCQNARPLTNSWKRSGKGKTTAFYQCRPIYSRGTTRSDVGPKTTGFKNCVTFFIHWLWGLKT